MTYSVAPRAAVAGRGQGVDLGVGLAVALMPAFADDLPVAHHHGADQRIRLDAAAAPLRQFQGVASRFRRRCS